MPGVTYALADFVTGGPIVDLPVMQGASWAAQLNRPDSLSCSIDLRDPEALALDLRAGTEPKKTILLARTDEDVMLAWGVIDDERKWDETKRTLSITAKGVKASWLDNKIIGPASARTAPLMIAGRPNPALDTTLVGYSLGTFGKKLIAQALTWPGAPTWFSLPADQVGAHYDTYLFTNLKRVGKALDDLTDREDGPDFAFDLSRHSNGLTLVCTMRHGSQAEPRIGSYVGVWPLGGTESPISGFDGSDNASDLATVAWGVGGKQADSAIMSRVFNDDMIDSGYPPLDFVDATRSDVSNQTTLDSYTAGAADYVHSGVRSISFSVEADAAPRLGEYRPGDRLTIDVGTDHPWYTSDIQIRLTSISGDETGKTIKIGCEVIG